MSKLLFITLNDHVAWGGSEELWSKEALELIKICEVGIVKKKWPKENNRILDIIQKGGRIYYKPEIKPPSLRKIVISLVKTKLGIPESNAIHDLEVVKDLKSYNLAVLTVGNHAHPKIVDYTNYLKQHSIPYFIVVQLATDLRNLHDDLILKLKLAYKNAIAVGYLSLNNMEILEIQLGFKLANAVKLNNPFNYNQVYLKLEESTVYNLACVAAFTSFHKGQELLLKVLEQEKWKLRNICFNFYGSGNNENQLKSLVELYGLERIVKFKGFEDNKVNIWKTNSCCIMPSRMEGQSLAMLEAMSFGRMVISTKVGDADRLIDDGKTGFLIDAPTVELIDKTLERAWEERMNWEKMGKLSREKLFKEIPVEPIVGLKKELLNLIDKKKD